MIPRYVLLSKSVREEEILSPLLFNRFLGDIEEFFFITNGVERVSIDALTNVVTLSYANDFIIICYSVIKTNKALKCLTYN